MILTLIRTDKKNKKHLKRQQVESMLPIVSDNAYDDIVNTLRNFIPFSTEYSEFPYMHRLPVVYPSVALRSDAEGNAVMKSFSGWLTLTAGPLCSHEEVEAVKQATRILPFTIAAFAGSSGKTVKIVIGACRPDGSLPQTQEDAERFCQQAYPMAGGLYEVVLRTVHTNNRLTIGPAVRANENGLLMTGFRMTYDDSPVITNRTLPLLIPESPATSTLLENTIDTTDNQEDTSDSRIGKETRELIQFLEDRYSFRMNKVMGYVEYQRKDKWHYGWMAVDERVRNGIAMEARLAGLNVWDKDIHRYLRSSLVRPYDPIDEYLWSVRGQWDGKDHIGRLARTVPNDNPHWEQWFRTWFLGMVMQWRGHQTRYGNSMVPLLISQQGYNKSTFCKLLLPPELQWGYTDNLVLSERKSVLQAMSQFLLVNLDEFNQISPKVQEGFLKNLVQLASVKLKRPYGKHVEDFPRLASFIATSNVVDLLSDPSGNRRFIGVELTGPIDVSCPINYPQLYAQAITLLDQKEPYWLDEQQTRLVMESNKKFQLRFPEEMYFAECFEIPDTEKGGQWMTAAAVHQVIKRYAGSAIQNSNIRRFGRFLANMDGLRQRRTRFGMEYFVSQKPTK